MKETKGILFELSLRFDKKRRRKKYSWIPTIEVNKPTYTYYSKEMMTQGSTHLRCGPFRIAVVWI